MMEKTLEEAAAQDSGGEPLSAIADDHLDADEEREIEARAADIARQIEAASGANEMEILDSVANVGLEAQKRGGRELDGLRVRISQMLSADGVASQVTKDLVDLRLELARIAPSANSSGAARLFHFPESGPKGLIVPEGFQHHRDNARLEKGDEVLRNLRDGGFFCQGDVIANSQAGRKRS